MRPTARATRRRRPTIGTTPAPLSSPRRLSQRGARAAAAGAQIVERDKRYTLALTALAQHNGVAALQALDALDQIEAGYGVRVSSLRSQHAGLPQRAGRDDRLAQRGSPPGLYYRSADDWVWLEGSDAASSLRN